jgi:hypothetical protein
MHGHRQTLFDKEKLLSVIDENQRFDAHSHRLSLNNLAAPYSHL